jgi:hypothetical protein
LGYISTLSTGRHGREDEFGRDAETLAAVIRTYREILDSQIV